MDIQNFSMSIGHQWQWRDSYALVQCTAILVRHCPKPPSVFPTRASRRPLTRPLPYALQACIMGPPDDWTANPGWEQWRLTCDQ